MPKQSFAQEQFFQIGTEYDSNVYKNFGKKKNDFLLRGRYALDKNIYKSKEWLFSFQYQQGVKKFFENSAQDQLIQSFSSPFFYKNNNLNLFFAPSFKILIERSDKDVSNLDINENYTLPSVNMGLNIQKKNRSTSFEIGANHFKFYSNDDFSFMSEWAKLSTEVKMNKFSYGAGYIFSLEQFLDVNRNDNNHDLYAFVHYKDNLDFRLSYTFSDSNSSESSFSFLKHQLGLVVFYDLGEKQSGIPVWTLHASTQLQWSKFPTVFDFDDEGQRFLLTESEGQTFNSFVVKLSHHISEKIHIESKFTQFSNDLSSQQSQFKRRIFYLGTKYLF